MRPAFHFTANRGWINDPHGITFRDGQYHVFYQYVPDSTVWAPNCHWGHARGRDLFSLKELPVAIAPGDGDDGIWTGSLATDDHGDTRILYTATTSPHFGIGRIRVATPTDSEWIAWTKGDIVAESPKGLDVIAFRDPFLVKEPDGWRMFVGAGTADGTAMAFSYRSADLSTWTYEGITLQRSTEEKQPMWLGALWECPQFIEVDGQHLMVSSVWDNDVLHYAGYALGSYADGHFDAKTYGRLTYGPSYYAPSFFRDAQGRPCLIFWMRGAADAAEGWASAHSVPHLLSVENDHLVASPHPDLENYRGSPIPEGALPGAAGDVLWSPSSGDTLTITSGARTMLLIEARARSLIVTTGRDKHETPYFGGDVRVIIDSQVVEVTSSGGMLGLVLDPPSDPYSVRATSATVFPLVR